MAVNLLSGYQYYKPNFFPNVALVSAGVFKVFKKVSAAPTQEQLKSVIMKNASGGGDFIIDLSDDIEYSC